MHQEDTRRELFRLGPKALELIQNTGFETVNETLTQMAEMEIYHLPYERIDIEASHEWLDVAYRDTPSDHRVCIFDARIVPKSEMEGAENYKPYPAGSDGNPLPGRLTCIYDGLSGIYKNGVRMSWNPERSKHDREDQALGHIFNLITNSLIFLLATENAEKTRDPVKRPKGRKKLGSFQTKYRAVTTISGRATSRVDDSDPKSTGKTGALKMTHVRRGHIRNQHYGPGNSFVKKVWIAPIIVNADKSFLAPREAYNVSL